MNRKNKPSVANGLQLDCIKSERFCLDSVKSIDKLKTKGPHSMTSTVHCNMTEGDSQKLSQDLDDLAAMNDIDIKLDPISNKLQKITSSSKELLHKLNRNFLLFNK